MITAKPGNLPVIAFALHQCDSAYSSIQSFFLILQQGKTVKSLYSFGILSLAFVLMLFGTASAGEEPGGLLLRKGLVNWQVTVNEARTFIEENIIQIRFVCCGIRNRKALLAHGKPT
jgi:hypothetical protein